MMTALRRKADVYAAIAATVPKTYLAYSLWFWIGLVLNAIQMMVFVFFWRAIYADTGAIGGLTLQQTLNYILLARVFDPLLGFFLLYEFGVNLREGGVAHVLLRPLDLQSGYFVMGLAMLITELALQLPMAALATLAFGLRWPTDPLVWGAFIVAALLGRSVLFFFEWGLAALTFYTTEIWGLSVLIFGAGLFFSGSLVPPEMMPDWLRLLVQNNPFAQVLYVPISLLSGTRPLADAPGLWLRQAVWIAGLFAVSRIVFGRALRKVTVQGG
jgi:ABC-2 type transport system permease protein